MIICDTEISAPMMPSINDASMVPLSRTVSAADSTIRFPDYFGDSDVNYMLETSELNDKAPHLSCQI